MAKSRASKAADLSSLEEKMGRMKSVVFSGYTGLSVKDVTELRRLLRADKVELVMTKKTLLRRALPSVHIDAAVLEDVPGEIALAFGFEDEVTPAKLLAAFAKTHETMKLKGGVVDGMFLPAKDVIALAKLPGRDELRAKLVWTMKSPVTGFVTVMAGPMRGLLNVLSAYKDQRPA